MTRKMTTLAAIAMLGIAVPAAAVSAQNPAPARAASSSAGPTVGASAVGVRRSETTSATSAAPAPQARLGAGRNVALMVVGGAALIIGAVIGGTAGVLIAVTGAALGLYGLYNFVQ